MRARLATFGFVIPRLGKNAAITVRWGYRCQQCNRVALYFIGDTFADHSGNEFVRPPASVPIDQIPWRQDMSPELIDRHTPGCQWCKHEVALHARYLRDHLIVDLAKFEASRTKADAELERMRRERVMGGRTLEDISKSGMNVQMSDDFGAHATIKAADGTTKPLRRVGDALSAKAVQDIQRAEAAGVLHNPIGHGAG